MNRREMLQSAIAAGLLSTGKLFTQSVPPQFLPIKQGHQIRDSVAIINGNVWTMDTDFPRVEAILIRDGRIVQIGLTSDIRRAASGIRVVDAGGKSVLPGFIDSHTHMEI